MLLCVATREGMLKPEGCIIDLDSTQSGSCEVFLLLLLFFSEIKDCLSLFRIWSILLPLYYFIFRDFSDILLLFEPISTEFLEENN
jgi:hypothetical protein